MTPHSIRMSGHVVFSNGEIETSPTTELMRDYVVPEGFPNQYEALDAALHVTPRDEDHKGELKSTQDKNKTGLRTETVAKLIPGARSATAKLIPGARSATHVCF